MILILYISGFCSEIQYIFVYMQSKLKVSLKRSWTLISLTFPMN